MDYNFKGIACVRNWGCRVLKMRVFIRDGGKWKMVSSWIMGTTGSSVFDLKSGYFCLCCSNFGCSLCLSPLNCMKVQYKIAGVLFHQSTLYLCTSMEEHMWIIQKQMPFPTKAIHLLRLCLMILARRHSNRQLNYVMVGAEANLHKSRPEDHSC